jgi:hypothetical protein
LRRIAFHFLVVSLFSLSLSLVASAQSTQPPTKPANSRRPVAIVRAVHVLPEKDGPAVEILSNHPLVPSINKIDNPPRLVIDLPDSRLVENKRKIDFRSAEIGGVRLDQFQNSPPITRVVVDLLKPITYSWDAAGNRLMIRLHPSEEATAEARSVPALTLGTPPVAVPVTPTRSGAVMVADSRIAGGSSITAGSDAAVLRLARGGEVRVCPGTTVSVTSSQNGRNLMLGMSTGALEANYKLSASADSILTPDFRILLAGPGEFHYAISADSRGNTCVRALPGNTASVIVSELLGDGTYQVKPSEQIVFRSGRLTAADSAVPTDCGCPAPAVPVTLASEPPPVVRGKDLPASVPLAQPGDRPAEMKADAKTEPAPAPASGSPSSQMSLPVVPPESAPLPPSHPNDVHVQVEAPFVFRADEASPATTPPPPAPAAEVLPVALSARPAVFQTVALPPPQAHAAAHHGFFGKMKGFFAKVFG